MHFRLWNTIYGIDYGMLFSILDLTKNSNQPSKQTKKQTEKQHIGRVEINQTFQHRSILEIR